MALLMTDMAAGGQAARQLQQNIIGAQYDPANAAASAEETQLKLQQDRLAAAYAPQKAAQEAEQEKMRLDKMRLQETMQNAQYKSDTETNRQLEGWLQSDEGKKATDADKIRKAAILKMTGNRVEEGTQLFKQAETIEKDELIKKGKLIDQSNESIGKAYAAVEALDPNDMPRFNEFVNRFPDESKKAIYDKVGQGNWEKYTPQEKKDVLKRLFLNTKGLLDEQKMENNKQRTTETLLSRERNIDVTQDAMTARKEMEDKTKIKIQEDKGDQALALQKKKAEDAIALEEQKSTDRIKQIKEKADADLEKEKQKGADALEKEKERQTEAMARLKEKGVQAKELEDQKAAHKKELQNLEDATKERLKKLEDDSRETIEKMKDATSLKKEAMRDAVIIKVEDKRDATKLAITDKKKPGTELKDWKTVQTEIDKIDKRHDKEFPVYQQAVKDAETAYYKEKDSYGYKAKALVGGGQGSLDAIMNRYNRAIAQQDDFLVKNAKEQLTLVESAPDYPGKEAKVKYLNDTIKTHSVHKVVKDLDAAPAVEPKAESAPAPAAAAAAPAPGATAAGKVGGATSNKFTPEQQTWFDAAKKANPTMSDADIIAEGKKRKKL